MATCETAARSEVTLRRSYEIGGCQAPRKQSPTTLLAPETRTWPLTREDARQC